MAEITREELLARYAAGERDFSGLNLSRIKPDFSDFKECFADSYGLNCCNFQGANFSYVNFTNTFLMYCDFRDTICFRANFTDCVFSGTNFSGADLREANLNASEGIGVIFENVDFRGAEGHFPDERILCLRNCIGSNGEFIKLFNEETIREESYRRYIEERYGIPLEQLPIVELTPTYDIDGTEIPF